MLRRIKSSSAWMRTNDTQLDGNPSLTTCSISIRRVMGSIFYYMAMLTHSECGNQRLQESIIIVSGDGGNLHRYSEVMSRLQRPRGRHFNANAVFELQTKESADLPSCILKQARKSGQLNLSNRGMIAVPEKVWNIYEISPEESKQVSHSWNASEDDRWWDQVDLTKLNLSSNRISDIPDSVAKLETLQVLNLRDNMITRLSNEIQALKFLFHINLSHNRLAELPDGFFLLKDLRQLDLSHNCFSVLHEGIGNFNFLEDLNISDNQLTTVPHTIGYLSRVTNFSLSNNLLQTIPPEIGCMLALKVLDCSNNKLTSIPTSVGELCRLEQLYLRYNRLQQLPLLQGCTELKELHVGYNMITEIQQEHFQFILKLKFLELRDNKISTIPEEITLLQDIERFDLSNNQLNSLPATVALLPNIKHLSLEGNPLRSIRRDILQRGTVHLLKFLRSRLEKITDESPPPPPAKSHQTDVNQRGGTNPTAIPEIDMFTLKKSRCLNWSNRKADTIPEEFFKLAGEAEVSIINLSKNQLSEIPESIRLAFGRMMELQVSSNKLVHLPSFIGMATSLTFLDVSINRLSELPEEIGSLTNLREIWLSGNRFKKVPSCLYSLTKLEIILASDNSIEVINVDELSKLQHLATLNLQNNNIGQIPPQLGNLSQLRSLQLEGNPFRHPRTDILAKGTVFLLQYLRDRIPK